MSAAFVKVDLHGLRQDEAQKVIDKAIASADSTTYQIQLIISCAVREGAACQWQALSTDRSVSGDLADAVRARLHSVRRI